MKKYNLLILLGILLTSCSVYRNVDFANKAYFVSKSDLGLMGDCKIVFINDSTLLYEFNEGSCYSYGSWKLKENKIIFHPFSKQKVTKMKLIRVDDFYMLPKDSVIEVKSKNKLLFDGLVFRETLRTLP